MIREFVIIGLGLLVGRCLKEEIDNFMISRKGNFIYFFVIYF